MRFICLLLLFLLLSLTSQAQEKLSFSSPEGNSIKKSLIKNKVDKSTWSCITGRGKPFYLSCYHEVPPFNAEELMGKIVRTVEPAYYLARFRVMKKFVGKRKAWNYFIFSIESKEYVPLRKPMSSIYMVLRSEEGAWIISTHISGHKLKKKVKREWLTLLGSAFVEKLDEGEAVTPDT